MAWYSKKTAQTEQKPEVNFYYKIYKLIEQKVPNRTNPAQVLEIIKSPKAGVSQDELFWSGLEDWLGSMSAGEKISKEDVLNQVKGSAPQLATYDIPDIEGDLPEFSWPYVGHGELTNGKFPNDQEIAQVLKTQDDYLVDIMQEFHAIGAFDKIAEENFDDEEEQQEFLERVDSAIAGNDPEFWNYLLETEWSHIWNYARYPHEYDESRTDYSYIDVNETGEGGEEPPIYNQIQNRLILERGLVLTDGTYGVRAIAVDLLPSGEFVYDIYYPKGHRKADKIIRKGVAHSELDNSDVLSTVAELVENEKVPYSTEYEEWSLPGGDKYRETLITWENMPSPRGYTSPHFSSQEDIIAHYRSKVREDKDGNSVLFIEEIQSDWHQAGRSSGYASQLGYKDEQDLFARFPGIDDLRQGFNQFKSSARALYDDFIREYGLPQIFHTNQNFSVVNGNQYDSGENHTVFQSILGWQNFFIQNYSRAIEFDFKDYGKFFQNRENEYNFSLDGKFNGLMGLIMEKAGWRDFYTRHQKTLNDLASVKQKLQKAIKDAPYSNTEDWAGLVLKKAIERAIVEGHDKVGWTPGWVQSDRYDFSDKVDKIVVGYIATGEIDKNLTHKDLDNIELFPEVIIETWKDDEIQIQKRVSNSKRDIEELIGFELHERVRAQEIHFAAGSKTMVEKILVGDDLVMDSQGMNSFYDKMLPSIAKKLFKRYNGNVETGNVLLTPSTTESDMRYHFTPITIGGSSSYGYAYDKIGSIYPEYYQKSFLIDSGATHFKKVETFETTIGEILKTGYSWEAYSVVLATERFKKDFLGNELIYDLHVTDRSDNDDVFQSRKMQKFLDTLKISLEDPEKESSDFKSLLDIVIKVSGVYVLTITGGPYNTNKEAQEAVKDKAREYVRSKRVEPGSSKMGFMDCLTIPITDKMKESVLSKGFSYYGANNFWYKKANTFMFHVTNEENAYDIYQSGQLDVHAPDYGTDQNMWPDESVEDRAYFTIGGPMWDFAPELGKPVALRMPASAGEFRKESTGDYYTTEPISADAIEILAGEKWMSLNTYFDDSVQITEGKRSWFKKKAIRRNAAAIDFLKMADRDSLQKAVEDIIGQAHDLEGDKRTRFLVKKLKKVLAKEFGWVVESFSTNPEDDIRYILDQYDRMPMDKDDPDYNPQNKRVILSPYVTDLVASDIPEDPFVAEVRQWVEARLKNYRPMHLNWAIRQIVEIMGDNHDLKAMEQHLYPVVNNLGLFIKNDHLFKGVELNKIDRHYLAQLVSDISPDWGSLADGFDPDDVKITPDTFPSLYQRLKEKWLEENDDSVLEDIYDQMYGTGYRGDYDEESEDENYERQTTIEGWRENPDEISEYISYDIDSEYHSIVTELLSSDREPIRYGRLSIDNDIYDLYRCETLRDCKVLGSGTSWCFRAEDTSEYETAIGYLTEGDIWVIYKNNKPFRALDLFSQQYMDPDDRSADKKEISTTFAPWEKKVRGGSYEVGIEKGIIKKGKGEPIANGMIDSTHPDFESEYRGLLLSRNYSDMKKALETGMFEPGSKEYIELLEPLCVNPTSYIREGVMHKFLKPYNDKPWAKNIMDNMVNNLKERDLFAMFMLGDIDPQMYPEKYQKMIDTGASLSIKDHGHAIMDAIRHKKISYANAPKVIEQIIMSVYQAIQDNKYGRNEYSTIVLGGIVREILQDETFPDDHPKIQKLADLVLRYNANMFYWVKRQRPNVFTDEFINEIASTEVFDYFSEIKQYISDNFSYSGWDVGFDFSKHVKDKIMWGLMDETNNTDMLIQVINKAIERGHAVILSDILGMSRLSGNKSSYDIGEKIVSYIINAIDGTEIGGETAELRHSNSPLRKDDISPQFIEFMAKNFYTKYKDPALGAIGFFTELEQYNYSKVSPETLMYFWNSVVGTESEQRVRDLIRKNYGGRPDFLSQFDLQRINERYSKTWYSKTKKAMDLFTGNKINEAKDIELKFREKGVDSFIWEDGENVYLERIISPGGGLGSEFMRELSSYADSVGKSIVLEPDDSLGGDVNRLRQFYSRFGFEPHGEKMRRTKMANITNRLIKLADLPAGLYYGDGEEYGYEAEELAKKYFNVLRGTEAKIVVLDNERVVAALFTDETNSEKFSFDVVVHPEYQRMGIGKELVETAIGEFRYLQDVYGPDYYIDVHVINPNMRTLLESMGFDMHTQLNQGGDVMMKYQKKNWFRKRSKIDKCESEFTNEKGNPIEVRVEKRKSKDKDLEKEFVIKIIGPKSMSENIITEMEAKELSNCLNSVVSHNLSVFKVAQRTEVPYEILDKEGTGYWMRGVYKGHSFVTFTYDPVPNNNAVRKFNTKFEEVKNKVDAKEKGIVDIPKNDMPEDVQEDLFAGEGDLQTDNDYTNWPAMRRRKASFWFKKKAHLDSDEKQSKAEEYFEIGHDDGPGSHNFLWIWSGSGSLQVEYDDEYAGSHSLTFSNYANNPDSYWKGRYDGNSNKVSVVPPNSMLQSRMAQMRGVKIPARLVSLLEQEFGSPEIVGFYTSNYSSDGRGYFAHNNKMMKKAFGWFNAFWVNTNNSDVVELVNDTHGVYVLQNPELFGLSQDDPLVTEFNETMIKIEEMKENGEDPDELIQDVIVELDWQAEERAFENGWVRVNYSGNNRSASIEAPTERAVARTIRILEKELNLHIFKFEHEINGEYKSFDEEETERFLRRASSWYPNKIGSRFSPEGTGGVPNQKSIDYFGFTKEMTPKDFLSLAAPIHDYDQETVNYFIQKYKAGEPVGNPFLTAEYDEETNTLQIKSHEGRHRMRALLEVAPDETVPVHIFPIGKRARDFVDRNTNDIKFLKEQSRTSIVKTAKVKALEYMKFVKLLSKGIKDDELLEKMIYDLEPAVERVIQNSEIRHNPDSNNPWGNDVDAEYFDENHPNYEPQRDSEAGTGYWINNETDEIISYEKYFESHKDEYGHWMYSDAYMRLLSWWEELKSERDFDTRVVYFERFMQFIHGIGDSAHWFIEGGSSTVDRARSLGERSAQSETKMIKTAATLNDLDDDDFWDLFAETLGSYRDGSDLRQEYLDAIYEEHGEDVDIYSIDLESVYISPGISNAFDIALEEFQGANTEYEFPYSDLLEQAQRYSQAIFSDLKALYPASDPESWGGTGYVLPDGTGLYMSEEGYRMDHRSISPVMEEYLGDIIERNAFARDSKFKLTLGAMGVMIITPEARGVMLFQPPTRQQLRWIHQMLKDSGSIILEYRDKGAINLSVEDADYELYRLFGE